MSRVTLIVLVSSLVVNGILLAAVVGILPFLLYVSVLLLVAASWYIKVLLNEMNKYNTDIMELLISCQQLHNHIDSVHEMEMFYGEPVLQELIDHTRKVNEEIEFYVEKYSIDDEEYISEEEGRPIEEEEIE